MRPEYTAVLLMMDEVGLSPFLSKHWSASSRGTLAGLTDFYYLRTGHALNRALRADYLRAAEALA